MKKIQPDSELFRTLFRRPPIIAQHAEREKQKSKIAQSYFSSQVIEDEDE